MRRRFWRCRSRRNRTMTSAGQVEANRLSAMKSTVPRSPDTPACEASSFQPGLYVMEFMPVVSKPDTPSE
jgi:hypothetical protein